MGLADDLAALTAGRLDCRLESAINAVTDAAINLTADRLRTTRSGAARHLLAVGIATDQRLVRDAVQAARGAEGSSD